ncbi:GntR family transcriptional regulator [Limimaricola sp. ASW11-118]|uniref:GntR family transcriptional regulator n=1 Tax=Limimaricola litoreus TaxID=2955316 RepID=A0A9X2FUJ2_9RHOB|nr:GntR family transcriptional regulator [Limimaricola litoreus]
MQQRQEEHIAAEFGVSRTPVRSAIQKLVTEELLEQAATRSAVVSQWGDEDLEEIFELRIFAEGRATAWAALLISDEDLDRMGRLNAQI